MFSWNRLQAGIKAVFFVQIVNRMGDFVFPFLTLLLTQVQHFSPAAAGLVVTLAMGLESIGGLVAGRLSDRHGRRDVLVLFLSCSGLLLAGAGFAPSSLAAAVAIVSSGFFVGAMRPVLGALVADLSDPETRRAAFSLSYFGINIGVSVGPLMAGWLFNHAVNWLFWLDALSTAAALLILVRFVPRRTLAVAGPPADKPEGTSALEGFVRNRVLFPFALFCFLYNIVYSQMIFTLGLQLVDLFGAWGPQTYGTVWAINAVSVIIITPLALKMTGRWSNLRSMACGMVFFTLGTGIFLFKPGLALVFVSTILWSTGEVLFSIHVGDLVSALSPPEFRGRYQAYVQFLATLGFVASPVASGLVAQALGLGGVWLLATVMIGSVAIGYALLDRTAPVTPPSAEAAG